MNTSGAMEEQDVNVDLVVDLLMELSIEKLLAVWPGISAFHSVIWSSNDLAYPLTFNDVRRHIVLGTWEYGDVPYSQITRTDTRRDFDHARRVAWLVMSGGNEPIEMDIGCPSLGYESSHPLVDGHHRLAAAIYLGCESIMASVSGEIEYANQFEYKVVHQ